MSAPEVAAQQHSLEPLAGVRVLDFTHVLAGPFCTRLLADFGADVVRVETGARPDRLGAGTWKAGFKDKQDRPAAYLNNNRSKRGITVNLKTEAGRKLATELGAQADIIVENFSAGVMERNGLGYDVLRQLNPGLLFISMSGFGQTGPRRGWTSMNINLQACSGLMMATGEEGEAPIAISNSWNDYIGGLHACFLLLEALERRETTGEGRYLDLSQFECSVASIGTLVVQSVMTGRAPRRMGNRSLEAAPQGCYRCSGVDEWCAISVQTNEQWQRLVEVAGLADWARGRGLETFAGRQAGHDDIDQHFEAWTRTRPAEEVEARLNAAGVPTQKMLRIQDLIDHPRGEGVFRIMPEPRIGEMMTSVLPFSMTVGQAAAPHPAPRLGEHTDEVLREWLGQSDGNIVHLRQAGALA